MGFCWLCCGLCLAQAADTNDDPVIDADMDRQAAIVEKQGENAPPAILKQQRLIPVKYYGFDGKIHQGQVVIDHRLAPDIQAVFDLALKIKFPIQSAIPISDFGWDDNQSMAANNSSGFNYRFVPGTQKRSKHAYGFAIDINPRLNPFIRGDTVLPAGAGYQPGRPGTLTPDCPIVKKFLELGWTWGGHWKSMKDYHHFQKVP